MSRYTWGIILLTGLGGSAAWLAAAHLLWFIRRRRQLGKGLSAAVVGAQGVARTTLAAELHDGVVPDAYASANLMYEHTEAPEKGARSLADDLRSLSHQLDSGSIAGADLASLLRLLAFECFGDRATLHIGSLTGLDPAIGAVLGRLAEEAFAGIEQCGDEVTVTLDLSATASGAELRIVSSGYDTDICPAEPVIASMRDMATAAGGTLDTPPGAADRETVIIARIGKS